MAARKVSIAAINLIEPSKTLIAEVLGNECWHRLSFKGLSIAPGPSWISCSKLRIRSLPRAMLDEIVTAHAGTYADTHASKVVFNQVAASKATTARLSFSERRNSVN